MFWLFFFLGLSVVFIFGVSIYMKRSVNGTKKIKSNNANANQTVDDGKKSTKIKSKWHVEDVRDSVISLKGWRMSIVIKLNPIDFVFLSENEQEAVENALVSAAMGFNYPVQFFETTEYVETDNIISNIQNNVPDNQKLRSYADSMVGYLQKMSRDKNVYARRNYIVLSYDGSNPKEAYKELDKMANILKANLLRANVTCERLNSDQIIDLIHTILNKGKTFKPSAAVKNGAFELYVGK